MFLRYKVIELNAHLVLMLPLSMGVVTTLLFFKGWLRTERGTVILVGSFPCRHQSSGSYADIHTQPAVCLCSFKSYMSIKTNIRDAFQTLN